RKGIEMFRNPNVNVPVLGIVENMAWFTPAPHPEEKYYIFGNGGAKRLADKLGVELLAQIPLVARICEHADSGSPIALAAAANTGNALESVDPEAKAFADLATAVEKACDRRNEILPPSAPVATH
ncbi:MAG: Mrp/NBP35 family ATP-binding protein, partial [Muribaculaceae bacterium]|nr:Mrp/NBP35 family ATP-binding protein [Muribaculaceae bacterium]